MSTLAPAPFSAREHGRAYPARSLPEDLGGEPTLDELLAGVWEGLAAHRSASCPVCGGEMAPEGEAERIPVSGRCRSCETTLS